MKFHPSEPRILALTIRASRLGFVVFAGPKQILDWGTYSIPRSGRSAARSLRRILSLLTSFTPSVIVVKMSRRKRDVNARFANWLFRFIVRQAKLRSILVVPINETTIKVAFRLLSGNSKYDRARVVVSVFPELAWKMPLERKPWESEPRAMMVFDAAMIGFVYWQEHGSQSIAPT